MKWTVGVARQRFSELLRAVREGPQTVYNRDREVAVVVDERTFRMFTEWQARQENRSIREAFDGLRRICAEDHYVMTVETRQDRANAFGRSRR